MLIIKVDWFETKTTVKYEIYENNWFVLIVLESYEIFKYVVENMSVYIGLFLLYFHLYF